tara:strand:+ start:105 stop:611 length:507 start_codon:yes stop_codon:yes gene_type:complete
MRIGELLVRQGVLSESEVEQVLKEQARRTEPFGAICERLLGVSPNLIEDAWADQYAELTGELVMDFDSADPSVREVVTSRQAWQFRILPIRWEDGALVLATTRDHLQRALRFATNGIPFPVFFVVTDADSMASGLERHYPMGDLGRSVVEGGLEKIASDLASRRGSAA